MLGSELGSMSLMVLDPSGEGDCRPRAAPPLDAFLASPCPLETHRVTSMRYTMALMISCFLALGAFPDGAVAFNLTRAVRLVNSSMYLDGGTVYFVLVGTQAETLAVDSMAEC